VQEQIRFDGFGDAGDNLGCFHGEGKFTSQKLQGDVVLVVWLPVWAARPVVHLHGIRDTILDDDACAGVLTGRVVPRDVACGLV